MRINRRLSLLISITIILVMGCSNQPDTLVISPSGDWPAEGWPTSTPEEQGMDSEKLADMLAYIDEQNYDIDAVVIMRHGHMVMEADLYPFKAGQRHVLYSCTKSVMSALIGIAIEQGYLEGVDQRVTDIFSDYDFDNLDAEKESITIEDVLTMSTGLDCQDSYLHSWRGLDEIWESDDWIQFMLDLPMIAEPGTKFEYCNGGSFLLSAMIQETTGMTAQDFAEENLFGPLGITNFNFETNPQGYNLGYKGLFMLPEDMAKFGHIYLYEGVWEGEQIVPAEWVADSTRQHIQANTLQPGYGYQWWIAPYDAYMALGYQGQYIAVVPDLDLVAVFVSELPDKEFIVPNNLIQNFIIPAAQSDEPLPENHEGVEGLQAQIDDLSER